MPYASYKKYNIDIFLETETFVLREGAKKRMGAINAEFFDGKCDGRFILRILNYDSVKLIEARTNWLGK